MGREVHSVYLRKGDRGLYTYINRKIYFIDKEYSSILDREGIAFVFITKEKDKYGFLGGSYEANNWDNGDYKEYLTPDLLGKVEDIYNYNGCIFYFIRDNFSDAGISVYYYNSNINELICVTGRSISRRGACSDNIHIRNYIAENSRRVADDIYLSVADILPKNKEDKTSLFKILLTQFYTCPLSVSILSEKILKITEKGYFEERSQYGVVVKGKYCCVSNYFQTDTSNSLKPTEDLTEEFKVWCDSYYISKSGVLYPDEGLRKVTSEFLGAKKEIVLVDKFAEDIEAVYSEHKEEVEKSVKEYKDWVSGLRKYVSAKNAKQYREIQLDKLLWTGDL